MKTYAPLSPQRSDITYLALSFAGQFDLDASRGGLHLVHAAGRASRLRVPAGWLSLCIPLSGCLQLESADGDWALHAGRMQVWRDGELKIDCASSGDWLCLAGPLPAWSRYLRTADGSISDRSHLGLFARESECPRILRRLMVRLARAARGTASGDPGMLVEATCAALLEQQQDLHERLQRCSGRTLQRRQQTLMRLLRVRQLIDTHRDNRPDLARLARNASYSPWHLIRMYRDVFDETPFEYAARLRLERAWSMVRDTRLPICEITEALGFESQSSFCRAFKNAYGATTGDVRQGQAASGNARTDALASTRAA